MITATQREARFFKGTENGLLQITADAEITTSLLTGWALLSKIADICLIREMFEGADPRLL
jgi:hypothetical protein